MYQDMKKVVFKAKNNKAVGLDNMPNEIFKNEIKISALTKLFNSIFDSGIIPTLWTKEIIKDIPKHGKNDPRLPLKYRGISLLSKLKIYC